jgi:multiple sugar transport system substrate-binding protein
MLMSPFHRPNRRAVLKTGAALAGAGAANLALWAQAWAQSAPWKPETGASLTLLRWKRFVQAEEDAFMALVASFTKATGVQIKVVNESLADVQPKASVAANTNQGPDLFWGLYSLPHLFPSKCVEVTDVANYLGKKYGGWVPTAVTYGQNKGKWICIPVAYNGNVINYRISALKKAGFSEVPKDTAGFLKMMAALKAQGTPGGMALGRAAVGDGNAWVHWAFWSQGGNLVDKSDKVIVNSPQTVKALEYCKALSDTFIPGTASWDDSFNNKAFLAGAISLTNNGVSIYAAAKAAAKDAAARAAAAKEAASKAASAKEGPEKDAANKDAAAKDAAAKEAVKAGEIADDMSHSLWPVGPVGRPTEFHIAYPMLAMKYTKFPNACKAFMAFTLEAANYDKWLEAAVAYLTHPLVSYDANPVWKTDPKLSMLKDASRRTMTAGGLGSVGEKAAGALADSVIIDMVASVCTGQASIPDAIKVAERQAKRIYR